ncbi:MAG TPA: hypothetical protein DCF49_02490 [Lachnospiraceae bacterium]|nr:hypothetical protein [Lachnospiraceae bacterium]
MELERIASDLYRGFPANADKLAREMERLRTLLEETGAAVMMEIEKEKYRKEKDSEKIKEYRKIYRAVRRELDSLDSCTSRFSQEQSLMKSARESGAQGRIDYDAYRVDETVPYTLDSVLTNKKPSAFSIYGQKIEADSWKEMLLQVCAYLNRMNPMLFASLESDPDLQGRKRPYFSADGAGLDTPAKIPDADLYVETHFSARYFKKMISKLLQKYNISEEAVLIYLKKDFTALHEESARTRTAARTVEPSEETVSEQQLSFSFDSEGNWNG